ncbi:MAG: M48 family metalloprotease [Vulcanimicrobiota bacterium]
MKVRPLHIPPTPPAARPAPPAVAEQSVQDVLEVGYATAGEITRESLKFGGRGLKLLGLPALGAAVAGPIGLVVGVAASSLAKLASRPSLKQTLTSVGLATALGVTGLALGPAVAAGLAAASFLTGAVAGGWNASRRDAEVTIRPEAFAQKYIAKVNLAVARVKPQDTPATENLMAGANHKQCAEAVLKAFQLAATNLPSGAALSLAGESARELLSPDDLKRFDQALLRAVDRQGKVYPGEQKLPGDVPLKTIKSSGPSPAFAANQLVMIDRTFAGQSDQVTRDLVLGHELSHVRHKDAAFKQGVKSLNEMLTLACPAGNLALDLVKVILQGMLAQESKAMELRADGEGYDYARALGHSPEAVQAAASKLFGRETSPAGMFDSHPAGSVRIQALAERAKSSAQKDC